MSHNPRLQKERISVITELHRVTHPSVSRSALGGTFQVLKRKAVNSDATFSYVITKETTKELENGTFYVIAQHPMQNNQFDIYLNTDDNSVYNSQLGTSAQKYSNFRVQEASRIRCFGSTCPGTHNDPNVDDTFSKLSFVIGNASEPVISYLPDISTTCYDASTISIDPSGDLEPDTPRRHRLKLILPILMVRRSPIKLATDDH